MAKKKIAPEDDFSVTEPKADLFAVLKNLTEETVDRWNEFERGFSPFMVSRFLSMQSDLVFYANEMNKSSLSPKEQYTFYLYALPKRRRYFKYIKSKGLTELEEHIMSTLNVNRNKARAGAKLLNNLHEVN